ncbi:MAG: hypothetical protein ACLUUO_05335 [Sellimonas intestinalis]
MYEIIKQVILSGDYELSDMLNKIKKNCVRGDITDEQETELIALAREKATPENSYAGIQSQVDYMMELLAETIGTVTGLKQDVEAIKKSSRRGRDRYSRTGAGTRDRTSTRNINSLQERMTLITRVMALLGKAKNMIV